MLPYRVLQSHASLVNTTRLISSYYKSKLLYSDRTTIPILYGDEASPPVRFVLMTASALGFELDFQRVDLFLGQNKSLFYKKINPLQKVPSMYVEKQIILESSAIALYLCQISDKKNLLYPEDSSRKAKVDQMLFFNSSELFPIDSAIMTNFFAGIWPVPEEKADQWYFLLDYLEKILTEQKWLTGDEMTLADLCCASTISSLQLLLPLLEHHVKLNEWMNSLNSVPCFDTNKKGLKRLQGFIDKMKDFYESNKVC